MNDVVDVVKMFLDFTGPRKGNPENPFFFREIQVLVNFCFIIWRDLWVHILKVVKMVLVVISTSTIYS